nr:MAG TPA: hypothetical protein [Bacteriophage sp.]
MAYKLLSSRLSANIPLSGTKDMPASVMKMATLCNGVQTTEQQVERKYSVEWHKGYAGIRNEDGYFVQDISLKGLETKEERMQHVVDTLKSWK